MMPKANPCKNNKAVVKFLAGTNMKRTGYPSLDCELPENTEVHIIDVDQDQDVVMIYTETDNFSFDQTQRYLFTYNCS